MLIAVLIDMFSARSWAQAFINTLEKTDSQIEDSIETLRALASFAKSLPGAVFGRSASEKLEALIRTAVFPVQEIASPAFETGVRFLILMVRKNALRHINSVIEEAEEILNKKRGVVTGLLEYALPLKYDQAIEEDFISNLKEAIKKRTGAAKVDLTQRLRDELLGGFRLRIGDVVIDASVRSQLQKLLSTLQSGEAAMAVDGGY